jgi:DNA-binding LytR/AlgR family response regulator
VQGILIKFTRDHYCECPISLTNMAISLEKYPFFRIHRKYLINISYVVEYNSHSEIVRLEAEDAIIELPLSRRNKKLFIEAWQQFSMQEQVV